MACDSQSATCSLRVRCTAPSAGSGCSRSTPRREWTGSHGSATERRRVPWADDREFRTQQAAALRAMTDPPLVRDTPHRYTRRVFWLQPTIDPPWPVSERLTTAPRTPQTIAFNQTFVEMRKGFKVDGEASAAVVTAPSGGFTRAFLLEHVRRDYCVRHERTHHHLGALRSASLKNWRLPSRPHRRTTGERTHSATYSAPARSRACHSESGAAKDGL